MKYMLIMNSPRDGYDQYMSWPKEILEANGAIMEAITKKMDQAGELVGTVGLASPKQAKLVRTGKDGKPITDGVFPESKEFLAGYWIVDATARSVRIRSQQKCRLRRAPRSSLTASRSTISGSKCAKSWEAARICSDVGLQLHRSRWVALGKTMNVRTADEAEIGQLATLWHDSWQDAHAHLLPAELIRLRTLESFRDRLQATLASVRVVGPLGAPVGFCIVKGDELYQLFVSAQARGTGAAAALIADAETRIAAAGVQTAWLACNRK